jgi:multidrug efflux system membrane fusion protein
MQTRVWVAISLLLITTAGRSHSQDEPAKKPPTVVGVRVVEQHVPGGGTRYSATIAPSRQVELAFKVGGYVQELLQVRGADGQQRDVQEGDQVVKGTVLAQLREVDYVVKRDQAKAQLAEAQASYTQARAQLAEAQATRGQARAQLAEAQALHEHARLDFERATNLLAVQSLTRSDYDAAQSKFTSTQARVSGAQAQLDLTRASEDKARAQLQVIQARIQGAKAQLAEAELALRDSALRAPMDAVVLKRPVEIGTLVSPGTVGFVLADTTTVEAVFGVPDLMVQRLHLGQELVLSAEALPGVVSRGRITRIAPSADPKSRVFEVEVTLPNPHQQLKVGSIASLQVADERADSSVAVVPLSAVVRPKDNPTGYAVFVVEDHGGRPVARSRGVKLGDTMGNMVAVLEGVKIGERVITTGAAQVVDGDPIRIMP